MKIGVEQGMRWELELDERDEAEQGDPNKKLAWMGRILR